GHSFCERAGRILNPSGRAQQAKLFARKIHKEDAALQLATSPSKQARKFEDARCATRIVVGAGMDLTNLRWCQRIEVAATEVIVMSTDHDVFVGLPGQPGKNVVDRGARGFDVDMQRQMKCVRKSKRRRFGG